MVEETSILPGIKQINIVHGKGETITDVIDSGSRMGFVIAQHDRTDGAIDACNNALNKIKI